MKKASKAKEKPHIIVICGPTATGKSDFAVAIARALKMRAEIISADSRQVYRGMDIGSGKITRREMKGVVHHLLDVADPRARFSAEQYRIRARKALTDILARGKTAIICGGTGFYIDAILQDDSFPSAPPNPVLRAQLAEKTAPELLDMLTKLDKDRAATIRSNPSDRHNRVRIIRAIEIASALGTVPKRARDGATGTSSSAEALGGTSIMFIGLTMQLDELAQKIRIRLDKRMRAGMIAEVARLHAPRPDGYGLSWKRLDELGLEYRYVSRFLRDQTGREKSAIKSSETSTPFKAAKAAMLDELALEIRRYAKRQMTWFKRNPSIKWIDARDKKAQLGLVRKIVASRK